VPVYAAELTVGHDREADRLLLGHDVADGSLDQRIEGAARDLAFGAGEE
jgi:hypothetical protein